MPSPEQILGGLGEIANHWQALAIFWHLYFAVCILGLTWGMRPSVRIGGVILALPLLSVSVLAWAYENPFNGTVFAFTGIALLAVAVTLPNRRIRIAPLWAVTAGTLIFIFGWVYPHFLNTPQFLPYLYSAPTGLIPCPTLSIIIGLSFIAGGFDSRVWTLVLGIVGAFYGVFGAVRLGVTIDWILTLGALAVIFVGEAGASDPSPKSRGVSE